MNVSGKQATTCVHIPNDVFNVLLDRRKAKLFLIRYIITQVQYFIALTQVSHHFIKASSPQLAEGNVLVYFGAVVPLLLGHVTPLLSAAQNTRLVRFKSHDSADQVSVGSQGQRGEGAKAPLIFLLFISEMCFTTKKNNKNNLRQSDRGTQRRCSRYWQRL